MDNNLSDRCKALDNICCHRIHIDGKIGIFQCMALEYSARYQMRCRKYLRKASKRYLPLKLIRSDARMYEEFEIWSTITIYILVLIFYITSLHFVYFVVMVGRDWAIATFVNETSETCDCRWHREILATVNVLTNLTAGGNPSVISNITYTISKTNVPTKVRSFWF